MKATLEEYDFHCRILARNDPTVFATFVERVYTALVQRTQRRAGPRADAVLVEEAVGQALLDYHDAPQRYDPNRADLHSYLAMAAYHDFQNAQAKEERIAKHVIQLSDPTLQEQDIVAPKTMASQAREEALWQIIDATFPDPVERQIVLLILNKVRPLEPYARLLELSDLAPDEQRAHVERVKERITKRLRRNVAHHLDL